MILNLLVGPVYMAQSQTYADPKVTGNSVLNIVTVWGGRSVFNTGDVKKVSFSGGDLILLDSKQTSHSFNIDAILSLNFRNYPILTSISSIVQTTEEKTILYPNPATDRLYFKTRLAENDIFRVDVLTLNGKTLISKKTNAYQKSISVSGLSPGIYICKIYSRNIVRSSKFIKQ